MNIKSYNLAICLFRVCHWYCCIRQSNLLWRRLRAVQSYYKSYMAMLGTKHDLQSSILFFPLLLLLLLFLFFILLLFLNYPRVFSLFPPSFPLLFPIFLFLLFPILLLILFWMQWYVVLYMVHSSSVLIFYCLFEIKVHFKVDVSYFGETVFC